MRRALVISALLLTGAVPAQELSLKVEGQAPAFESSPLQGEQVIAGAARLHVVATHTRWSVVVRAAAPFASQLRPELELPLDRLRISVPSEPHAPVLELADHPLVTDQAPTLPEGRWITLDYAFRTEWGDRSLPEGEAYSTRLVFTVISEADTVAYAAPSPFSPDADGVRDATELHLPEGVPTPSKLRVLSSSGATVATLQGSTRWDGTTQQGAPAPDGTYTLIAESSTGASVASVPVRLERAVPRGTGRVFGQVRARNAGPVEGVTLELRGESGALHSSTLTDATGSYQFSQVPPGRLTLTARRDLYYAQTSPQFDLTEGAALRQDLELIHNHSLVVSIRTHERTAGPGELVPVEVVVRAVGTTGVDSVRLQLAFGAGLRPLAGTFRRDGSPIPVTGEAVWLGTLQQGEQTRLRFLAAVGAGAGVRQASATVVGVAAGEEATAGPVTAKVQVSSGELAGRGGVYGRVCYDLDHDGSCGPLDSPVSNTGVFLEEGSFAQADAQGRFHLAPLRPGRHLLVAGPGPLVLSPRGTVASLPRSGATHRTFLLPAGQYLAVDLPLTPPPGFVPESRAEEAPLDPDEGDLLPWVARAAPKVTLVDADEGGLDENGLLVGLKQPVAQSPGALEGGAPTGGLPSAEPTPEPQLAQTPLPGEPNEPGTAYLGLGEATLNLGLDEAGQSFQLTPTGRLALTLQHDFGALARATLVVDTARTARGELLAGLDRLGTASEFGDEARVSMSTQEKLYLRLDLPWLSAELGRLGGGLRENELLYFERSVLGAEIAAGNDWGQVRAFGGFASEFEVIDSLRGQDSTGPYLLSHSPVLPGSERVELELRAAGRVINRVRLQAGIDYFLDAERGTVDLAQPLFANAPSGEENHLVIRYQVLTEVPLFTGGVGGLRASLGRGSRQLGLTALYQSRPGAQDLTAVAADGRLGVGPVLLEASAGVMPTAPGELLDRSAARARLTVTPIRGLELFGFGAFNGTDWEPTVRSSSIAAALPSQFSLLGTLLGPTPLATSLALAESSSFPVLLGEQPGSSDLGGGVRVRQGPVSALTLFHRSSTPAGSRDHADAAVSATLGASRAYAAHGIDATPGGLFGPTPSGGRQQHTVAGASTTLWDLGVAGDYRHSLSEEPAVEGAILHEAMLRLRYQKFSLVQPATMLAHRWRFAPEGSGVQREVLAGVESHPAPSFQAFAYGRFADAQGEGFTAARGAFAGVSLRSGRSQLLLRYDLSTVQEGLRHGMSWSARGALPWDLIASSDGQLELPTGRRLLRVGLAYRPLGPVQAIARAHEELDPATGALTRMGAADLSIRLHPRIRTDLKYLYRWQREEDVRSVASLAGANLSTQLFHGLDLVVGGRYLRDLQGGGYGGQLEVGYTLAKAFRVGLGWNLSTRPEVFTLAGQSQGLYLNLTASDAGSFKHGARAKAAEAAAIEELQDTPLTPSQVALAEKPTAPPPTAPVSPARVQVSGRLYGDRNGNGSWDAEEPVFEGVPLGVEGTEVVTDKRGQYSAEVTAGGSVSVSVRDFTKMPFTHLPPQGLATRAAEQTLVTVDLVAPRPATPTGAIELTLADGKKVRAVPVDRAQFPLAAWVAGLPLQAREAALLQQLATRSMEAGDLRLVILSRAQSTGPLAGAVKRAWRGAQALKRYLQATQMIPPKRMAVGVLEPEASVDAPLGQIELVLVRIQP